MNNILAVNFSTGLAAVLLCAAAIILVVMVGEIISMAKPRKSKGKTAKAEAVPAEQPAAQPTADPSTERVQPTQEQPREELPLTVPEVSEQPQPEQPQEEMPAAIKNVEGGLDKSFTARLILSDGQTKSSYSYLKNKLLKSGFESRICWRHESFRALKTLCAKLAIRGGGLCLFCALEPDGCLQYGDGVESLADKKTYKKTPLLYRVNGGGERQVPERIIADLAQKFDTRNTDFEECDFAALLPFEDMQTLIEKGLVKIKIYRKKPRTKKVENKIKTEDKIAVIAPPEKQKKRVKKPIKRGVKKVVNTAAVFANFEEGEVATFEEIKKRIFGNKQNITYIKILGGGKADKNITVIASAFSRAAEKNILDAGGKVIIKKLL